MAARKSASETTETKQAAEMEAQKVPVEEEKESVERQEDGEKKEPAGEPKRYMYVGPTVPGIGIQNRVYTDIPQEVVDLMNNGYPVIGDIFIQIRDFPTANRMIREQKGYLHNAYLVAEKIRVENAKKVENTFTGGDDTEERG